jgi:hypothetical protein
MDADVMITIVFFLEVFLFGLVATVAVAGGVRKANREATAETDTDRRKAPAEAIAPTPPASADEPNAGDASRLVSGRARRVLGGVHR